MSDREFRGPARFNHVAMSLTPEALSEQGRNDICSFYGEVFGWQEIPQMTEDNKRLVLSVHQVDQFVFLVADDEPMRGPRLDHFGVSVDSVNDLRSTLDKAKALATRDDRVDLIDYQVEDHDVLKIHNFYVGFLLPLMVEVQHFEFA
ncbi:MAG: VOC family protein [Acidobacteria bacterium]|nr:VOC family protein [Acidobacteriota bacterium]